MLSSNKKPAFQRVPSHGHLTMLGLLRMTGHRLRLRQLPVLRLPNSGNRISTGSRSKLSAVLSSNRMVIAVTSGSTSTASRVLPLTSGKRISFEWRLVVRLRSAIFSPFYEGDLWLGLPSCGNTIAARLRYSTEKAKPLKLGHYPYIGIFGFIIYLLYLVSQYSTNLSRFFAVGLLVLIIYIPLILFFRKFKFIRFTEKDSKSNKTINGTLNVTIACLLILTFTAVIITFVKSHFDKPHGGFFNLEGFGIPGLISLIALPLGWQFVDLTNWQRLLAVRPDKDNDEEGLHNNIRRGLATYAIESPFTWIIFLFFGALVISALPNYTFSDLLIDLPKNLIHSQQISQRFFGYVFIISVVSIMLSTIDSFLIGAVFAYVYDARGASRAILDGKDTKTISDKCRWIINMGRRFGLALIVVGVLAFILCDSVTFKNARGGESFINLLLAFYSAQLSFLPLMFGILFLTKRPSPFWAGASMVVGATSGICLGIYSVGWNGNWGWYPIPVCIALSTAIYATGIALQKKKYRQQFASIALIFLLLIFW